MPFITLIATPVRNNYLAKLLTHHYHMLIVLTTSLMGLCPKRVRSQSRERAGFERPLGATPNPMGVITNGGARAEWVFWGAPQNNPCPFKPSERKRLERDFKEICVMQLASMSVEPIFA